MGLALSKGPGGGSPFWQRLPALPACTPGDISQDTHLTTLHPLTPLYPLPPSPSIQLFPPKYLLPPHPPNPPPAMNQIKKVSPPSPAIPPPFCATRYLSRRHHARMSYRIGS